VLCLAAAAGRPCFAHPPAVDAVTAAGITPREADVLVLLLRGLTTAAVAARLCVSPSTARTHCRAVLRKFAAGDRRALRALLLAGPPPAPLGAGPEVCPAAAANFAEESAVAALGLLAHT
jgi:DNA-binding CsgD family transcriptional regulator